ncbi:MAG: tripartite tricarboxylate transporter substrate binding protein [Alphaproteobacteria bacterium]|nr:MAG: tripartite tricarboxylate transporter substrate binding protein [Alphaproteobacteria bacterium]
MNRRRLLQLSAGAAVSGALPGFAFALDYPARPVRIIVPYPPGIAPDIVARMVAQALSERLKQQFVVDNRSGGASNVGTSIVAHAVPDGYTLLVVTTTNTINTSLYDNLDFNLIRDIAPVAGLVRLSLVLAVNPSVPAQTLPEFIAYAKANPGKINYASVGSGAATNVAGELFKQMAGINLVNVPYRSNYMPDLISGQVQAAFTPILQSVEYIRAGTLRALAVTGATRSESLPGIPAAAEFVPGYEASVWDALGAPANTPADIVEALNMQVNAVLSDPALKAQFAALGAEPMLMTPAEFGKYIAAETEKWGRVVKTARIKVD